MLRLQRSPGNAALVQNGGSITSLTLTGKTVSVELLGGSVGKMQVQNITDRFCLTLGGGSLASFMVQNCNRAELVVLPAADAGLAARIAPAFSVTSSRAVAFVRDGGSGNGSSPENAAATPEAAYAMLPEGGTIVLCGPVSVTTSTFLPTSEHAYTLTSAYDGTDYRTSGAELRISGNVGFYTPTTFEKLHIYCREKLDMALLQRLHGAHRGRCNLFACAECDGLSVACRRHAPK